MTSSLRHVGRSGLVVSVVGLGCNNLGRKNTATEEQSGVNSVVDAALDNGISFFDVADCYGSEPGLSERMLGAALQGRREDVVIGTKFGMDLSGSNGEDFGARGSRRYVMRAVEASLQRLQTDYIDLYQFHTPDAGTPVEETLRALDDLIAQGKVRYIGHSNRSGWQIADAEHVARAINVPRFVSSQSHYNLMDRRAEQEVVPAAIEYDLGIFPYFPLASGLLTGKYTQGEAPTGSRLSHTSQHRLENADMSQLRALKQFAQERDLTEVQVAFSWLASRPQVASVIAGATRPDQVVANAAAVTWVPTEADEKALDDIFPPAGRVALF